MWFRLYIALSLGKNSILEITAVFIVRVKYMPDFADVGVVLTIQTDGYEEGKITKNACSG